MAMMAIQWMRSKVGMSGVGLRGVTCDRCWRGWSLAPMLNRAQELRLLQMEQWLREVPPEEGLARLARIETALRSSNGPADWSFVQIIVVWRLHQQLRSS